MGLAHRVTIVKGRLTDIDRDNRAIVISDEIVVEYDLLVLAAGVQGTYAFLVSCV
jgi:NADH dehydrogenase FAD-containing subunit